MGILDKFMNFASLNDDDYDDDIYDDDDEGDFGDGDVKPKSRKPIFGGRSKSNDLFDDDDGGIYDEPKRSTSGSAQRGAKNNITPVRRRSSDNEINVVKPTKADDDKDVIDMLLSNQIVVLNLEGTDIAMGQRIIDAACGATYALGGDLSAISDYIYLITPNGVEVKGDAQDLLKSAKSHAMRY
jgi:cell division inhibitor SepF